MRVIELNSEVLIGTKGNRNIPAEITAITLRPNKVIYEVTWWDGFQRRSEWIGIEEFTI